MTGVFGPGSPPARRLARGFKGRTRSGQNRPRTGDLFRHDKAAGRPSAWLVGQTGEFCAVEVRKRQQPWPYGRGIGAVFAATRKLGAELRRMSAIPSPYRHPAIDGMHRQSCGEWIGGCRKVFDDVEPIGFAPVLTFKGTSRIVPVCGNCLPASWRRRCRRTQCEHCGRQIFVFDQPEYPPRRFCLNRCRAANYYRKNRVRLLEENRRRRERRRAQASATVGKRFTSWSPVDAATS